MHLVRLLSKCSDMLAMLASVWHQFIGTVDLLCPMAKVTHQFHVHLSNPSHGWLFATTNSQITARPVGLGFTVPHCSSSYTSLSEHSAHPVACDHCCSAAASCLVICLLHHLSLPVLRDSVHCCLQSLPFNSPFTLSNLPAAASASPCSEVQCTVACIHCLLTAVSHLGVYCSLPFNSCFMLGIPPAAQPDCFGEIRLVSHVPGSS